MSDCTPTAPIPLEYEIIDDDKNTVGIVKGAILPDWESLREWMIEEGIPPKIISSIKQTTHMYPVAILYELRIEMGYRGNGHGTEGMMWFYESLMEEGAKSSLVIVDLREKQKHGFDAMKWMIDKHGYGDLGRTARGHAILFRRYDG